MFIFLFIFLFGLCIGSFLNVVIDRLNNNESVVKGRSYCDSCKRSLNWYDMMPVLSYLSLRGRCRFCHSSVSIQYPIIEFLTGSLFVATTLFVSSKFQSNLNFLIFNYYSLISLIYYLFTISSFIVIFFTDLKYGIIPDKVVFPAILVSFFFSFVFTSKESWLHFIQSTTFEEGIVNHLFSAVSSFLFFLLLYLITRRRGIGFGDVKLSFMMGLFLGFPKIITAFYVAFLTGAIVSLILVIWGKKKFLGGTIPFGPFLVFAALSALFLGEKIGITGYINQLLVLL